LGGGLGAPVSMHGSMLRSEVGRMATEGSMFAQTDSRGFTVMKTSQRLRPVRATFVKGDKDKSGFLEPGEGALVMQSLGLSGDLWRAFDENQDSRISFPEYKKGFLVLRYLKNHPYLLRRLINDPSLKVLANTNGTGTLKVKVTKLSEKVQQVHASLARAKANAKGKGKGKGKAKWAACKFAEVEDATRCTSAKSGKVFYLDQDSQCEPTCYPGFEVWPHGQIVHCSKPWYASESRLNGTFRCVKIGSPTPAPGEAWPTPPPTPAPAQPDSTPAPGPSPEPVANTSSTSNENVPTSPTSAPAISNNTAGANTDNANAANQEVKDAAADTTATTPAPSTASTTPAPAVETAATTQAPADTTAATDSAAATTAAADTAAATTAAAAATTTPAATAARPPPTHLAGASSGSL